MDTLIYDKLADGSVRCGICSHFCVIRDGKKGLCAVRKNSGGTLVSLVYPRVIAASVDPIEKKPLYHLKPGSFSYSIASVGCNFKCRFCQNADIAQASSDSAGQIPGRVVLPETIVQNALESGCQSISYTYTEPAVFFELALETARLAKTNGLLNVFVTNGYMSPQALEMAAPVLDGANVDLKAFDDQFYRKICNARIQPVKDTLRKMTQLGIHLEITTLLIPGLNDHPEQVAAMARYIADELGCHIPWHISRFHPCHLMTDRPPTPLVSLEKAFEAGRNAGLQHVYIGNAPELQQEDTFCPSCGKRLVSRSGYRVKTAFLDCGECPECHTRIYGKY